MSSSATLPSTSADSPAAIPAAAAASQVIRLEARNGWRPVDLRELWQYRELLWFLALRDVKVRYKQTILGVGWIVLQPLLTTGIFTFIFGAIAKLDSDGLPYIVFAFSGILLYQLFARALGAASNSLVGNQNLIKKVYFPRLIHPIAPVMSSMLDFLVGLAVLTILMIVFKQLPHWGVVFIPLFILIAALTGLALGLWLAALNVMYRDVGYLVPFITQLWMYGTPVVYSLKPIREHWPRLYPFFIINPLTGALEGMRWALGADVPAPVMPLVVGVSVLCSVLVGGLFYFRRMERLFADVV